MMKFLTLKSELNPDLWCHIGPGNVTAGMVRKSISSKSEVINSLESLAVRNLVNDYRLG